jgi:hypothetical protein
MKFHFVPYTNEKQGERRKEKGGRMSAGVSLKFEQERINVYSSFESSENKAPRN